MRAGLSTIQQTLTAEASAVLNRAIADAARRRHGQTTPLHVAAALLSSSSGHLRQACLRSHPNPSSSHPLQCRALELCFSVALDRLPSSSSSPPTSVTAADNPPPPPPPPPPLSNALMAALKRAQAHQRRGCPESQQQPLLAVKVELDHLLLSILDDPSVSRVMREASFSSPTVKATIENSLSSSTASPSPARNLYLNPRLVGAAPYPTPASYTAPAPYPAPAAAAGTDLAKVFDILTRKKKRNPILVGDADPGAVLREAIQKMEASDAPLSLRSVAVIYTEKEFSFSSMERTQIPSRIRELAIMVEARIAGGAATGVVLDLGDLKWLVDGGSQQQGVTDISRIAVAEMSRLLVRFAVAGSARVWLVGTATCATYLRCQVYFPTMESDWDLQAVPIAPRSPLLHGVFPRLESNGIASSRVDAFGTPRDSPAISVREMTPRGFPAISVSGMTPLGSPENPVAFSRNSLCNLCTESYERELAKLGERESEKPSSSGDQQEAGKPLPRWLQSATSPSAKLQRQERELMQKWKDNCSHLHRTSLLVALKPPVIGFPAMALSPINSTHPKLTFKSSSNNLGTVLDTPERPQSPPKSPVKTDLALGPLQKPPKEPAPTKFTGDATSIKRLVNGLLDKVSWQAEAASTVAAAIIQSKSGGGKRRGGSLKADTWLLFAGLDSVGKQKMAIALSELMFDTPPLIIRQGLSPAVASEGVEESNTSIRGRTSIDRVAETLRLNPFSTIFFEDFDRTDITFRGIIRRAMERGRLVDSHGREVGLGSSIFILTASWMPEEIENPNEEVRRSEERIMVLATSGRQLELQLEERRNKRRPDWLFKDGRLIKHRKDSLSLDLNLSTGVTVVAHSSCNEDAAEGSWNSSDLTVENVQDHGHGHFVMERKALPPVASSVVSELIELVDAAIVFKPVDFQPLRDRVSASVSTKFTEIMGEGPSIAIDGDALNQMTGGVWLRGGYDAADLFDEWTDQVFAPAVKQLRGNPKVEDGAIIRLSSVKSEGQLQSCLPTSVKVTTVGGR